MKPYLPDPDPTIFHTGKRIPPQPEPSSHFAQLRQQREQEEWAGNIWACAFLILVGSMFVLYAILAQVH